MVTLKKKEVLQHFSDAILYSYTVFRNQKKVYRAPEVDKADPLLKDPLMGRLIHPVRDQNSKQYLRPKACLHHHKIKRLLLSKSNQYEKGGPIAHN